MPIIVLFNFSYLQFQHELDYADCYSTFKTFPGQALHLTQTTHHKLQCLFSV